jgi:hypothetical protein
VSSVRKILGERVAAALEGPALRLADDTTALLADAQADLVIDTDEREALEIYETIGDLNDASRMRVALVLAKPLGFGESVVDLPARTLTLEQRRTIGRLALESGRKAAVVRALERFPELTNDVALVADIAAKFPELGLGVPKHPMLSAAARLGLERLQPRLDTHERALLEATLAGDNWRHVKDDFQKLVFAKNGDVRAFLRKALLDRRVTLERGLMPEVREYLHKDDPALIEALTRKIPELVYDDAFFFDVVGGPTREAWGHYSDILRTQLARGGLYTSIALRLPRDGRAGNHELVLHLAQLDLTPKGMRTAESAF